ncbi:MAG: hypothetical protein KF708_10755 [Pirellulales bacterium]|nr:hypothetical protein [Pirellulales bacterium]
MTDESPSPEQAARPEADLFENLGRKLDEMPAVQAAEQALRRATIELHRAQERYEQARAQAAEEFSKPREKTPGEIVETTLECVRKYPGAGVLIAAFVGFFLGSLFRR